MKASFNDDLRVAAVSLDWSLMTLEGMLHDSVRDESLVANEENAACFAELLFRFQSVSTVSQ